MTREQAEQIARKHVELRNKMEGHEDALSLSVAVDAIMEAAAIERADEREACAKVIEEYPHWLGQNAKREVSDAIRARGER